MAKKFLTGLNLVVLDTDPSTGSEGELYFNSSASVAKIYQAGAWSVLGAGGGGTTVSTTEPLSPEIGDSWYKNDTGEFYVYDGTYWVEVNGTISLSQEEVQDYVAPLFTHNNHVNASVHYEDELNELHIEVTSAPTAGFTSTLKHDVRLNGSIAKGQAVYVSSANGTNMIVSKASNASEATSSKTLGLLETGGSNNSLVKVVTEGLLAGLDTSAANSEGDPVWLGTDGNLIYGLANKPYAPAHLVFIGVVTRKNNSNGEIFVKVQNGFELQEIHNIGIGYGNSISEDSVLRYDAANGVWKNTADNVVTARNYSNNTIDAFMPVYFDTQFFESTEITFDIADASSELTLPANGVTTASVAHGSYSKIITSGIVSGMDLSSYIDGDLMYVGASGGFTKTRPTGLNYVQPVARVLSVDNGTFYFFGNNFASSIETLPNLSSGSIWYGVSGRPEITALTSDIVNEGMSNLFFTEERAQDATSSMITNGIHTGISVEYVDSSNIFNLTNTGVTSLTGTTNEISVSASIGNVTIGIPDSPTFVTPNIGVATATSINGTNIPSSASLVVSTDLNNYLTISSASTTYQPIGSYLTSETDPVFSASDAASITSASISNWNTAYGWGNHASAGYATLSGTETLSNKSISGTLNILNSGAADIGHIYIDTNGELTVWSQSVNPAGITLTAYTDVVLSTWGSGGQYISSVDPDNQIATIGDLSPFLTSYTETSTLEDVTDRGATSSNAITISNTTQSTTPTSGALIVSGGVGIAKDVWIDGNLHVNGTTITENTQTVATHDNLIYLNAAIDATITNAVYASGSITYTADNIYEAGMDIRVTGVDPSGFNIYSGDALKVASATPTQFIVVKSDPGSSYVSGGTSHAKTAANPDLGFAGGYYDAEYAHAGLFRDASDGIFKFFQGYTPEPDEAVNIDTTHASFAFADIQIRNIKPQGAYQSDNFGIGSGAMNNATGYYNFAIGQNAFSYASGQNNFAIGDGSMNGNTGQLNYSIGLGSLASNSGDYNYAFGHEAGVNNTGSYNVYIGKTDGLSTSNNIVIADNEGNLRAQYLSANSGWTLGTIFSATWNGDAIGYQYGGTGLTSLGSAGYVLAVNSTEDGLEWVEMTGGGGGAAFTDSAGLAAILSDETGTGLAVFSTSPTLTTPIISGGTIDNASIGATTASTGKFTSININGNAIVESSTGTTSATSSFNTTTYSSGEFIIYASTASGNYVSKVMMLARGTATPVITEYAILTQGTAPTVTITPSYSAPNAVLTVAVTSGTAIRIVATEVAI